MFKAGSPVFTSERLKNDRQASEFLNLLGKTFAVDGKTGLKITVEHRSMTDVKLLMYDRWPTVNYD